MDANTSQTSFFLPTTLRRALEREAVRHDRSLSAEIRCAIRRHVFDSSGSSPNLHSGVVHQPGESEDLQL